MSRLLIKWWDSNINIYIEKQIKHWLTRLLCCYGSTLIIMPRWTMFDWETGLRYLVSTSRIVELIHDSRPHCPTYIRLSPALCVHCQAQHCCQHPAITHFLSVRQWDSSGEIQLNHARNSSYYYTITSCTTFLALVLGVWSPLMSVVMLLSHMNMFPAPVK